MGQKINPLGFRLGATQGHHSLWFAQPQNYPWYMMHILILISDL